MMRTQAAWNTTKVTALVCLSLALIGCQSLRNALGLHKNPPNEFAVISHAPLALPPDLTLRPPQLGAPARFEYDAAVQGKQIVFPQTKPIKTAEEGAGYSDTEIVLLRGANALDADPGIRRTLTAEADLDTKVPEPAKKIPIRVAAEVPRVVNLGVATNAVEIPQPTARPEDVVVTASTMPDQTPPAPMQVASAPAASPMPDMLGLRRTLER